MQQPALKPALIVGLFLSACGGEPAGEPPAVAASEPAATGKPAPASGEAAYLEYCASCHASGLDGAPIVGRRSDWAGRSKLWQAVIMEHAKSGYFQMPAKGGNPELPDKTINAAVEYMLELTYADLPPDQ